MSDIIKPGEIFTGKKKVEVSRDQWDYIMKHLTSDERVLANKAMVIVDDGRERDYGALKKLGLALSIPRSKIRAAQPIIKDASLGRNDPCSCGSGKKFKRCHLK